jgi:phosphatidylethanolamine/phosphatidyl-N-methylethanolamine N-methyltransferase
MLREVRFFLNEFRNNWHLTGAIAPSSPWLARAISSPLQRRGSSPISILEAGPGTGAFTQIIRDFLKPGDQFDIFELNSRFYEHLVQMIKPDVLKEQGITCRILNEDIRNLQSDNHYDFIISGIPLNNFDAETVAEILELLMNHLKPEGTLSYFEYNLLHEIKMQFLNTTDRLEAMRVRCTVKNFIDRHQVDCNQVWLNLPPARARHFRNQFPRSS